MTSSQTQSLPDHVECPSLASALRASLVNPETESQEVADERFREAMAKNPDPDVPLRTDMSPQQAGPNDLLLQLHVAIARQADKEPDDDRRRKTIETPQRPVIRMGIGTQTPRC